MGFVFFILFLICLLVPVFSYVIFPWLMKQAASKITYSKNEYAKITEWPSVTIFIFVGYIPLKISKTDFYLNNLQSLMQSSIDVINEIIRFWISLPNRLMKYGQ